MTDEVKSCGMMLPTAVCGHTALQGVSVLAYDGMSTCRRYNFIRRKKQAEKADFLTVDSLDPDNIAKC